MLLEKKKTDSSSIHIDFQTTIDSNFFSTNLGILASEHILTLGEYDFLFMPKFGYLPLINYSQDKQILENQSRLNY